MTDVNKMFTMPEHKFERIEQDQLPEPLVKKLKELEQSVMTNFQDAFISLMLYGMSATIKAQEAGKGLSYTNSMDILMANVSMSHFCINIPRRIGTNVGMIIKTNGNMPEMELDADAVKVLIAASLHAFEEGVYAGLAPE